LEQLSLDIEILEKTKKEIETSLNSGTLTPEQLIEKSTQYGKVTRVLEEKEMRWLELSELDS
jgi:ATP-binding cassette subfamily F protein uup